MKWTQSSGSTFQNAEPGSHAAVCTRVIDLGTQSSEWQGEKKFARKVTIGFELDDTMEDGRPFYTSRTFTVSLHEKSALRKFLSGWRGRDFTPEELGGFDPRKLIGAGCLLSLVQNGEYVNIDAAAKLPKGMAAPKPVDTIFYSIDEHDQKQFDKLSDKIKEKISSSPEFQQRGGLNSIESDTPWTDEELAEAF